MKNNFISLCDISHKNIFSAALVIPSPEGQDLDKTPQSVSGCQLRSQTANPFDSRVDEGYRCKRLPCRINERWSIPMEDLRVAMEFARRLGFLFPVPKRIAQSQPSSLQLYLLTQALQSSRVVPSVEVVVHQGLRCLQSRRCQWR